MANEIIINSHAHETRIAVMDDHKLVELLVEKKRQQNYVGNIYKGIVKDVLPGMGAAFIDVGLERTGFLHYSDIVTDFIENFEGEPPKYTDNDSSKIGKYLKKGQELTVQVQKNPIGSKGARLTGQISIPGKFMVYFPNKSRTAISRKITSGEEKSRIKQIVNKIKDENVGLIIRTAAMGNTEDEFKSEYDALKNTWRLVDKQIKHSLPPVCIYEENDIFNVLIRDLFNDRTDRLVVDNKILGNTIINKLKIIDPELCKRVEFYKEDSPIFDAYGIEKEIRQILQARVNLPSGGNIVIEPTEALVSIDINTGSFTGNKNYEQTVRQTNIEAATEIARQLRLRDLAGIVVVDFIDMRSEKHKQEVMDALKRELKKDRAKNNVYPFGPLGLVEITRKRTRTNLLMTYLEVCPHCHGSGRVLKSDSVALQIHRWIKRAEFFLGKKSITIVVHPLIKKFLLDNPNYISVFSVQVDLQEDGNLAQSDFKVLSTLTDKEITHKYNA